jgi:hypothetical protein
MTTSKRWSHVLAVFRQDVGTHAHDAAITEVSRPMRIGWWEMAADRSGALWRAHVCARADELRESAKLAVLGRLSGPPSSPTGAVTMAQTAADAPAASNLNADRAHAATAFPGIWADVVTAVTPRTHKTTV